jgi:hypothetical protein
MCIMDRLLAGNPVELTSADPAVVEVRRILEAEDVWTDPLIGDEWDFGGSVYWSRDKAVALVRLDGPMGVF